MKIRATKEQLQARLSEADDAVRAWSDRAADAEAERDRWQRHACKADAIVDQLQAETRFLRNIIHKLVEQGGAAPAQVERDAAMEAC